MFQVNQVNAEMLSCSYTLFTVFQVNQVNAEMLSCSYIPLTVFQVSANMSKVGDSSEQIRQSVPALGLVWADQVMCRLLLSRRKDTIWSATWKTDTGEKKDVHEGEGDCELVSRRQLEVVFAPHLAQVVVPLVISQSGIACE